MRRLMKEYEDMQRQPHIREWLELVKPEYVNEGYEMEGAIKVNSRGSMYEGYTWAFRLDFPRDYPFKPPKLLWLGENHYSLRSYNELLTFSCVGATFSPAKTVLNHILKPLLYILELGIPLSVFRLQPSSRLPSTCTTFFKDIPASISSILRSSPAYIAT